MDNQNIAPQVQRAPQNNLLRTPQHKSLLLISVSGLLAGISGLITGLTMNGFPSNAPIEFLENFTITTLLFGLAFSLLTWVVIENNGRKRFINFATKTYNETGDPKVNNYIVQTEYTVMNYIFIGLTLLFVIITFFTPLIPSMIGGS